MSKILSVSSVRPDLRYLEREKIKQRKKRSPQLWDLLLDYLRLKTFIIVQ